jgi:hypothetical protein
MEIGRKTFLTIESFLVKIKTKEANRKGKIKPIEPKIIKTYNLFTNQLKMDGPGMKGRMVNKTARKTARMKKIKYFLPIVCLFILINTFIAAG